MDNLLKLFDEDIKKYTQQVKDNLNAVLTETKLTKAQHTYITHLKDVSDNIVTARPDQLQQYRAEFDAIIAPSKKGTKAYTKFKNRLLEQLGYEKRRSDFYPRFFYKLGIKSCVYCNAHLTVAIEKVVYTSVRKRMKSIYKAKFQVDHYWDKADYPCFSVSLYNLYPSCGSCNNCKSQSRLNFLLYNEKSKIVNSPFKFEISPQSITEYLLSRKAEDIKLQFSEPSVTDPFSSFSETFDIQGIYDTQKDLAEELILRAEAYTEQYRRKLKDNYPQLFTTPGIFNRVLLGNYSSEDDIHKRPMAKFTFDIAKQLGLIKGI
jgi:hypothetical protein